MYSEFPALNFVYLESIDLRLDSFAAKEDFLLDDDEEPVRAELELLQQLRENHGVSTGESSERAQSWVKLHMKIAEKRSLSLLPLSERIHQF